MCVYDFGKKKGLLRRGRLGDRINIKALQGWYVVPKSTFKALIRRFD